MASIKINDLDVAGMSLFQDPESYLDEVDDNELALVKGGVATTAIKAILSAIVSAILSAKLVQVFQGKR